jgi:hypothetical protein
MNGQWVKGSNSRLNNGLTSFFSRGHSIAIRRGCIVAVNNRDIKYCVFIYLLKCRLLYTAASGTVEDMLQLLYTAASGTVEDMLQLPVHCMYKKVSGTVEHVGGANRSYTPLYRCKSCHSPLYWVLSSLKYQVYKKFVFCTQSTQDSTMYRWEFRILHLKYQKNTYTGVAAVGSHNSHTNNNQQDSWWEIMYLHNGKSVCSVWIMKS